MSETTVVFIKGWRVNLRPDEAADVPLLTFGVNDPDTRRYMGNIVPKTTEEEVEWRLGLSKRKSNNIVFVLVVNGKAIGTMGLHSIDWIARTAITGTMIWDTEHRGKGYATEAKMLLLDYAFATLNLRKIYSEVLGANAASLAYAAKCGYVEEARLANHYFREGKYHDKVILAVYKKPWQKLWRAYQKIHGKKP
jgi:RimJ/RimL family protein N-acetyltransferase